jgi:ABC-type antimicrobial peptide transport system permease subunit
MRLRDLLNLVGKNLTRTRFRALLSAFGVVIGTAAIVVLFSLATGLRTLAAQNLGQLGPLNEITVFSLGGGRVGGGPGTAVVAFEVVGLATERAAKLSFEYLEELAEQPGVAAVMPVNAYRGQSEITYEGYAANPSLRGLDPDALEAFDMEMTSGEADLGRWQVIVGAYVGESFSDPSIRSGDNRVEALDLQDQTLTVKLTRTDDDGKSTSRIVRLQVAGVLAPRGFDYDYSIFLRLRDVDELNAWATGEQVNRRLSGYSQAMVLVEDAAQQAALEDKLSDDGFFAFSPNQILQEINQTYFALQAFVGGIGVITFLIAGTGIANTLITAIYERTAEIGLMKAVGATTQQVTAVFLAEAAAIGGGGGLAGLALGVLVSQVVSAVASQQVSQQLGGASSAPLVVTPFWLLVLAPLFAMGVGVVAGLYPARRAAQLDPVVALRYE